MKTGNSISYVNWQTSWFFFQIRGTFELGHQSLKNPKSAQNERWDGSQLEIDDIACPI